MAEVTLNDPADASTNVWAQQNPPGVQRNPPGGSTPPWDPAAPCSPTTSTSLEPEQSRELFRTTDPGTGVMTPPASQESFWLLPGSPDHVPVLESPSISADVGPLAPTSDAGGPVGGSVGAPEDRTCLWDSAPGTPQAQDLDLEPGILEQSQITLVSLTDTSDPEETLQDDPAPRGEERVQMVPEPEPRLAAEPGGRSQAVLEVSWGSDGATQPVYQHRRAVLLQKLSRRAQTLRTKGAESRERCHPGGAQAQEEASRAGCSGSAPRPEPPRTADAPLTEIPGEQRKLAAAEMHRRTRRFCQHQHLSRSRTGRF